jgi:subtilisin family serine protease
MLSWLPKPRRRKPRFPAARKRRRLGIEDLESRLLLSVDLADLDYETWRLQPVFVDSFDDSRYTLDELTPAFDAGPVTIQNSQATQLIGANQVWSTYGYTGSGYSVAVLDTGIDYNHANLSSQYLAGWDFVDNDPDPMDLNGHGTHVAGTIASNHATYRGVGPDLGLVGLRVLDASGSGSFGDVEDALQWVVANAATYNIVAVNMSLGTGSYSTNPWSFLEDEFQSLKSLGVFVAAASGNSFYSYGSTPGLGFPAISPNSVSVGAVWDGDNGSAAWSSGARDYSTAADRMTSFTQRSADLDILAPGAMLTSTARGGGFTTMAGTSMATPVIAASAAILHQALDANGQGHLATQDYLLSIMQQTGVTVIDGDDEDDNVTNTGLSFKRIDLAAAVASLVAEAPNTPSTIGLFSPGGSMFYLRDDNSAGAADAMFQYGPTGTGWTQLAGDWDGDGNVTVGLYHAASGNYYLKDSNQSGNADATFRFGPAGAGWRPAVGDWDGDGDDTIGLYDPANGTFFLKNTNQAGYADQTFRFGPKGTNWLPLAGDWDGDGTDTIGLFKPSDSLFLLSNTPQGNFADLMFRFGPAGAGWLPLAGDWDADGSDSIGLYQQDQSRFYLSNSNQPGAADSVFRYGPTGAGWLPLAGFWNTGVTCATQSQATPDAGTAAALLAEVGSVADLRIVNSADVGTAMLSSASPCIETAPAPLQAAVSRPQPTPSSNVTATVTGETLEDQAKREDARAANDQALVELIAELDLDAISPAALAVLNGIL